ncbi:MAG: J domain-containing protein [Bradymonadales bacterium]|nr:J domain-containing protein [Bradymonadales bacterium]
MTEAPQTFIKELSADFERLATANYYELLGVSPDASEEVIRKNFRELAKRYHTDRYAGLNLPKDVTAKMTHLLGMISRAHAVLTNAEKRKDYDATLAMREAGLPTDLETIVESESVFRSGKVLLDQAKYAAALEKFEKANQLNPAEPEFSEYATYCRYWMLPRSPDGNPLDWNAAKMIIDHLTEFQKENPNNDTVCVHLAMIAKVEGRLDQALDLFRTAYSINRKNVVAARELRLSKMRQDRKPKGLFQRLFGKKGGSS